MSAWRVLLASRGAHLELELLVFGVKVFGAGARREQNGGRLGHAEDAKASGSEVRRGTAERGSLPGARPAGEHEAVHQRAAVVAAVVAAPRCGDNAVVVGRR